MALNYSFNGDSYTLLGGCGDSTIVVPDFYDDGINGIFPVVSINSYSFFQCNSLEYLIIGKNVNFINYSAFGRCNNLKIIIFKPKNISLNAASFGECSNLKDIKFEGNAPTAVNGTPSSVFIDSNPNCKIYRKKHFVTGWNSTFGGKPVVLWSDNVIKSGGTVKLTTKKRPNFIYTLQSVNQINNPSGIISQGLKFYITKQTLTINLSFGLDPIVTNIYYDETNTYALWAIRSGPGAGIYWVITPIDRVGLYDPITGLGLGDKYYLRGSDNPIGSYGGGGDWSGNSLTVASLS